MKLIAYFFEQNRITIISALLISVISGVSSALIIGIIGQQFNQINLLTAASIGSFIGLIVISVGTNLLAKWMLVRLMNQKIYVLRMDLAQRILSTPYAQIEKIGAPRLVASLAEDAKTIGSTFLRVPLLFINLAIVLGCLFYLAWLSPLALFALFILALPIYFIYRTLNQKAVQQLHNFFWLRDQIFEQYEALTAGAKELQMSEPLSKNFFTQHLEPTADEYRQSLVNVQMAYEFAGVWSQIAYFIFIVVLLLFIAFNIVDTQILGAYALVALYMRGAINQLLSVIPQWAQAAVALDKINALELTALPENARLGGTIASDSHEQLKIAEHPLCIQLNELEYSYRGESMEDEFTIGPLNIALRSGELIFITGANGSGKTTLFKVLTSLYWPSSGYITLNNIAVTCQNQAWYRQHFSVVFADFYLFEDLVAADALVVDKFANDYLSKLQLEEKVTVKDGHLSTINLSTGQRKRLALLSAYLTDRPVYVFDEWAANQDPLFKEFFYRQLLPELKQKNKLVIVISHDDRYFDVADRIIRLDYGQIEGN